jgi:hypothetical protein
MNFTGTAVRTDASQIHKHKGKFVCLVGKATGMDATGTLTAICSISGVGFAVTGMPQSTAMSQLNEYTCLVDPNDAKLLYRGHAMLNDDFDQATYGKMVKMIENHYSSLFY